MAVGLVSALLEGALVELLEAVGAHEALGVELAHHGGHAATLTKEKDIYIKINKLFGESTTYLDGFAAGGADGTRPAHQLLLQFLVDTCRGIKPSSFQIQIQ